MPTTKKSKQEQPETPAKPLDYRVEQSGSTLSLIKYIGGERKGVVFTYASTDTRMGAVRNFAALLEQATMEGFSVAYLAYQAENEAKELAKSKGRKAKTQQQEQQSAVVDASSKEADAPATQDTH